MSEPRSAGRELDTLVSEVIFGIPVVSKEWPCYSGVNGEMVAVVRLPPPDQLRYYTLDSVAKNAPDGWPPDAYSRAWVKPIPRYSTSLVAAMAILDSWRYDWNIKRQNEALEVYLSRPSYQYAVWSQSLPEAICQCAIVMAQSKEGWERK